MAKLTEVVPYDPENVDPDFGFPLDDRGRIKLNERP